jgi:hypothetical protein
MSDERYPGSLVVQHLREEWDKWRAARRGSKQSGARSGEIHLSAML